MGTDGPLGPADLPLAVAYGEDGSVLYVDAEDDDVVEPVSYESRRPRRHKGARLSEMRLDEAVEKILHGVQTTVQKVELSEGEPAGLQALQEQLEAIHKEVTRKRKITHEIERDKHGRMLRIISTEEE